MSSSLTALLPPAPQRQPQSTHLLKPTTTAIPRNTSPYNHVHTPLLLAYYAVRFPSLVADPLTTMIQDLLPISLAQCVFCATCLPAAGTWGDGRAIISGTGTGSKGGKSYTSSGAGGGSVRRKGLGVMKKESMAVEEGWGSKIVPTTLSLLLTLLPVFPLTFLALILGAPLWPYSSLPLTLLLATHVSLLGFLPLFYTHGVSGSAWRDILAVWLPFDRAGVWGGTVGCIIGGWLGAVPIALDWDREWQAWPCTVLVGVVAGWAVGRLLTGELGLGVERRIDLGEWEGERIEQKGK